MTKLVRMVNSLLDGVTTKLCDEAITASPGLQERFTLTVSDQVPQVADSARGQRLVVIDRGT